MTIHGEFMAQARRYCMGVRDTRKANEVRNELSVKDLVLNTFKSKISQVFVFEPNMGDMFAGVTHVDSSIGNAAGKLVRKRKRVHAPGEVVAR